MRVDMVDIVKGFIIAKKDFADSDVDLIYNIWGWQLRRNKPPKKIESMSVKNLMKCWKDGVISSPSSIGRARRKCQEAFPETRGKVYAERMRRQQKVKLDLKRNIVEG